MLEIGCGSGALAGALHRWYPNAEITAVDLDSEFIRFAREHESGVQFMEGDITSLPFEDNSFDVVISNTVSEHIEPSILSVERFTRVAGEPLFLAFWDRADQRDFYSANYLHMVRKFLIEF